MEKVTQLISEHPVAVVITIVSLLLVILIAFFGGFKWLAKKDPIEEELDVLIEQVSTKQT